jgi:hypothetical protein
LEPFKFFVGGTALRATTKPAARSAAVRRHGAVGLAPRLDFVERRKASIASPSGLFAPPDTNAAFAAHENTRTLQTFQTFSPRS